MLISAFIVLGLSPIFSATLCWAGSRQGTLSPVAALVVSGAVSAGLICVALDGFAGGVATPVIGAVAGAILLAGAYRLLASLPNRQRPHRLSDQIA